MLVSSEFVQKDLLDSLETELKVKLRKFSPVVSAGLHGQINDLDAIYAMGACVAPPIDSLSVFNFLGSDKPKSFLESGLASVLRMYKEILLILIICAGAVGLAFAFFQFQLKSTQKQLLDRYAHLGGRYGQHLAIRMNHIGIRERQP